MSYSKAFENIETCTSSELEESIKRIELQLQLIIAHNEANTGIGTTDPKTIQHQLDDLRADLILKKQEEKAEMKQLLSKLLQMVELI